VEESETIDRQIPSALINSDQTEVILVEDGKELIVERYECFPEGRADEVLDLLLNKLGHAGFIAYFGQRDLRQYPHLQPYFAEFKETQKGFLLRMKHGILLYDHHSPQGKQLAAYGGIASVETDQQLDRITQIFESYTSKFSRNYQKGEIGEIYAAAAEQYRGGMREVFDRLLIDVNLDNKNYKAIYSKILVHHDELLPGHFPGEPDFEYERRKYHVTRAMAPDGYAHYLFEPWGESGE